MQMLFSSETAKEKLYFRGNGVCRGPVMELSQGACVSFDTYWNAFFYGAYLRYTWADRVRLCVPVSGKGTLELCVLDQSNGERVLETLKCSGKDSVVRFRFYALRELPADGALFLRATATGSVLILQGGWYEAACESCAGHRIRLACVICTYHREAYVKRTLARVNSEIWSMSGNTVRDMLDFFIVDNGNTLPLETPYSQVRILPNKNCGGSGGFARGLLEVQRLREKYTHVLLMDDDISFEPQILFRTVQFLSCAAETERPVCLGGQMLIEERPTIQHEAGGTCRKGLLHPNQHGLDLSDRTALLRNAKACPSDYQAWWYCCLPVCVIEKYGLPLPFFIKFDDVEYGIRIHSEIVLINGIGVWHMDFAQKMSTHLTYYNKRNSLVLSCVHGNGQGILRSIYQLVRCVGKAVLTGESKEIEFSLRAFQDFLKGVDFFLETDEEQLNADLLDKNSAPVRSVWNVGFELLDVSVKILLQYASMQRQYRRRIGELTSTEFWTRHLKLEAS